ncbi:MAG: hypothetical protein R3E48_19800 [Burkholderiaceae bacterium]
MNDEVQLAMGIARDAGQFAVCKIASNHAQQHVGADRAVVEHVEVAPGARTRVLPCREHRPASISASNNALTAQRRSPSRL